MIAYQQGWLDSMCGVYAITNAYKIVNNSSDDECQYIFNEIVTYLSRKKILKSILIGGMYFKHIDMIMKDVVGERIPVQLNLWKGISNPTTRQYWNSVEEHLEKSKNNCVIINMDGRQEHATVGINASKRLIHLVDSGGMKVLRYKDCTTTSMDKDKYILFPAQTLYLGRGQ